MGLTEKATGTGAAFGEPGSVTLGELQSRRRANFCPHDSLISMAEARQFTKATHCPDAAIAPLPASDAKRQKLAC